MDIYDEIFILWHSIFLNSSKHWHLQFRYKLDSFLMCHYYITRSCARSFTFFVILEKNAFFNVLYSYFSHSLHLWCMGTHMLLIPPIPCRRFSLPQCMPGWRSWCSTWLSLEVDTRELRIFHLPWTRWLCVQTRNNTPGHPQGRLSSSLARWSTRWEEYLQDIVYQLKYKWKCEQIL